MNRVRGEEGTFYKGREECGVMDNQTGLALQNGMGELITSDQIK